MSEQPSRRRKGGRWGHPSPRMSAALHQALLDAFDRQRTDANAPGFCIMEWGTLALSPRGYDRVDRQYIDAETMGGG